MLAKLEKNSRREKIFISAGLILCVLVLILDQLTKILVETHFSLYQSIPVIPDFFSLTYVTNKGAAWGIFEGKWYLLLGIAFLTAGACIAFFRQIAEECPERYVAIALLLSGILGNSIDRIWRGAVVDFLDFYVSFNHKIYHWPAFNVADIAICIGVSIFILSSLLRKPAPVK